MGGLDWFKPGKQKLVLIYDENPKGPLTAFLVEPSSSWIHGFSHVVERDTPYYVTLPVQAKPPDGKFSAGTHVRIMRDEGSYLFVRPDSGSDAFVESGALKPVEIR